MTAWRSQQVQTRAEILQAKGVLRVVRPPMAAPPAIKGQPSFVASDPAEGLEVLVAVWDDGSVTALHGHVDLGTGLRTALTQVVAEELDVPVEQVHMLMGSTAAAPNQGATIASTSLQIHAQPLRVAAAQARRWLRAQGAEDGAWSPQVPAQGLDLLLDLNTPVKSPQDYRVVGTSIPRVDIPGKATGEAMFVHDLRMPGMLHGRVVRPPYAGADHGEFIGNTLESVDAQSIAHIPGIRAVVVQRDFVGVVAEREEHAEQAQRELVVH